MIKTSILFIIAAFLFISATGPGEENKSACIYNLKIPPDLDVPGTPHFDTTIVRDKACLQHMLWFPPQGTETSYTIVPADTSIRMEPIRLHFSRKKDGGLDISTIPAGNYSVSLMACGNGGVFTLRIK